jgi:hypothetical protein
MLKKRWKKIAAVMAGLALSATVFLLIFHKAPPPNIVLIVVDALRSDHLSLYGYSRKTMPFVEDSAQNGVVFLNFYATSSYTITSHYSLFSSQIPNPAQSRIQTSFVEQLKSRSYRTYGVSANPNVSASYGFSRGFDIFTSDIYKENSGSPRLEENFRYIEKLSPIKNVLSEFIKVHLATMADVVNEKIFQVLEQHARLSPGQPFFFFINYLDPHDPYFPHSENPIRHNYNVRDRSGSLVDFFRRLPEIEQHELQELTDLYDGEIRYTDQHIYELAKKMDQLGLAGNTVFIITSDHGEVLGEHGLFSHHLALYEEELRIPMIIFGAGIKRKRLDALASHMDTGGLVMSLAQRQLRSYLQQMPFRVPLVHWHYINPVDAKWRSFLPVQGQVDLLRLTYPDRSVYFYQHAGQGSLEVYNAADREMRHNRINEETPSFRAEVVARIKASLREPSAKPTLSRNAETQKPGLHSLAAAAGPSLSAALTIALGLTYIFAWFAFAVWGRKRFVTPLIIRAVACLRR